MVHAISLYVALMGVWLLLSGLFDAFFLSLAAICCGLVVYIAQRMDVIDHEGQPVHISRRFITYLPWLAWQIIRANVYVARRIASPKMPIDPVLKWIPASQPTDLGKVIYANSITLTPGTIATGVEGDRIQVHALTPELMDELEEGSMDARVRAVEG